MAKKMTPLDRAQWLNDKLGTPGNGSRMVLFAKAFREVEKVAVDACCEAVRAEQVPHADRCARTKTRNEVLLVAEEAIRRAFKPRP